MGCLDRIELYRTESARYLTAGQEAVAEKFAEAYKLMLKAKSLAFLSSKEETRKRVNAAENAAKEASNMAVASSCESSLASSN